MYIYYYIHTYIYTYVYTHIYTYMHMRITRYTCLQIPEKKEGTVYCKSDVTYVALLETSQSAFMRLDVQFLFAANSLGNRAIMFAQTMSVCICCMPHVMRI